MQIFQSNLTIEETKTLKKELVAPCGMNCAVCSGYLALKHDVKSKGVKMPYCLFKNKIIEKIGNGGAKTKLRVQIDEGKNRHIRRLFGAMKDPKFGTPLKVMSLSRVSIGSLKLNLESSKWRYLSEEEENMLLKGLI